MILDARECKETLHGYRASSVLALLAMILVSCNDFANLYACYRSHPRYHFFPSVSSSTKNRIDYAASVYCGWRICVESSDR